MMKVDCRSTARTLLCTGLLLGVGVLARAQDSTSQQAPPAADNTKTNERDRSVNEPTADQQKENHSDREITLADTTIHHERQIAFHVRPQHQDRHSERASDIERRRAIRGREASN